MRIHISTNEKRFIRRELINEILHKFPGLTLQELVIQVRNFEVIRFKQSLSIYHKKGA